jgi:hypothetical protein
MYYRIKGNAQRVIARQYRDWCIVVAELPTMTEPVGEVCLYQKAKASRALCSVSVGM